MRMTRRICRWLAVAVMACGIFSPFSALAAEGDISDESIESILHADGSKTGQTANFRTTTTGHYDMVLTYKHETASISAKPQDPYDNDVATFSVSGAWKKSDTLSSKLLMEITDVGNGIVTVQLSFKNLKKVDDLKNFNISLNSTKLGYSLSSTKFTIPDSPYFDTSSGGGGGSSGDGDSDTPSADIVVENVIVTDSTGERIDRVTKDSPPFNIGIVYADYGLKTVDLDDIKDGALEVFLTNTGSFVPSKGNRGEIKTMTSTSSDAPRFRVDFKNVTWDGGSNAIEFQVRYNFWGDEVIGSKSVTVYQARAKTEDEEEKTVDPPTPYITVDQYSYGEAQIEAGTTFDLSLTFRNTSKELPLENILITFSPDADADLTIASASNSYYIENLAAGASIPYTIQFQAKPDAKVKSHNIQIAFKYEYVVKDKREVKDNNGNMTIAVPVTQIDRFAVDPVTEVPAGIVGEAAYINVSFINRGKSATCNISGSAKGNLEILAPAEHYGNLEAGKSDSIDITVVPQEPGELFGEIVVQYEDENTNQKEISVPFTMYVEAPYVPEPPPADTDPGMMEPPPGGSNVASIVFCSVGGVLMAIPVALYLMKRVKAKGSEEFDEEF